MLYDGLLIAYNNTQNGLNQPQYNSPKPGVSICPELKYDSSALDNVFNQESPYKYPALIICDDVKRINQSADVYQKYMDVITDECGNRFNTRNLNSSGSGLQAGYSANIDLDSHLKNINYYTDKCYYDNWKTAPNSITESCNGLKRNAQVLVPDYTPVGRDYTDCIGVCANTAAQCWNIPPTDLGCETDVKKRYDFKHAKFQGPNCIKPGEWKYFQSAPQPPAEELSRYPNGKRNQVLIDSLNRGVNQSNQPTEPIKHDYYQFFQGENWGTNPCVSYPQQRLFNNITKRSMLPNQHFRNSDPVYRS